jgi:hypothetical protein
MFLIVGLFVVPAAILLSAHMLMGIFLVHAQKGFWVVGPGQDGVEFSLLLIAGLISLLLGGPGYAAVDSRMQRLAAAAPPPQPAPVTEREPAPVPEPEPEPEPAPAPGPESTGEAEAFAPEGESGDAAEDERPGEQ